MENQPLKLNLEKNIALERQEAVMDHNKILGEHNLLPEEERGGWNYEKNESNKTSYKAQENISKMSELREKVGNIDKYRDLAKPFNDQYFYMVGDISTLDKLEKEEQRITNEIEKIKSNIIETTRQLNDLRNKLGMEPTEDIPSLDIKKERLPYLLSIQNDLKSKLNFEKKKQSSQNEEFNQERKIENRNLNENIQEILNNIQKLSRMSQERASLGYNKLFINEELLSNLGKNISDNPSIDEYRELIKGIDNIFSQDEKNKSINDNPNSLRDFSRGISNIANIIKEQLSKIKLEEENKQLILETNRVYDNLNHTSSFLVRKAQAMEAYLNTH